MFSFSHHLRVKTPNGKCLDRLQQSELDFLLAAATSSAKQPESLGDSDRAFVPAPDFVCRRSIQSYRF
jgi:hypothetical protein